MVRMSLPETYTKVSPQAWELVRAAYLSGLSATLPARRFRVTLSSLRKRRQPRARAAAGVAPRARPPMRRPYGLGTAKVRR
jgi:hypothetical protein